MNAVLSFNLAPFHGVIPGWQRCPTCDQPLSTASDWDTKDADMPIQLDNCGHTCHFSCLRAAFCEQIIRRPHRCVCPQCGIDAKIHHGALNIPPQTPAEAISLNAVYGRGAMTVYITVGRPQAQAPVRLQPSQGQARSADTTSTVEQAQAYQPTENEIFYARTQYFLEVELYGQPVTPVPDWLVPHLGEQR